MDMSLIHPSPETERFLNPPVSGNSNINLSITERLVSAAGAVLLGYLTSKDEAPLRRPLWMMGSAYLLYRSATGHCFLKATVKPEVQERHHTLVISKSVTINRPKDELYGFWRRLENLSSFMEHIAEVKKIDEQRSEWKAKIPGGLGTISWEAEIVADDPGYRIAWRSIPGSTVDNAGEVIFKEAPAGRGTEVHATISYTPPAGDLGAVVSKLFTPAFEQIIKEDIRRFKRKTEAGEIPTNMGQPTGKSYRKDDIRRNQKRNLKK